MITPNNMPVRRPAAPRKPRKPRTIRSTAMADALRSAGLVR